MTDATLQRPMLAQPISARASLSRSHLFGFVIILALANSLFYPVLGAIKDQGLGVAVANTFGVSVFVWVACWLATRYALQPDARGPSWLDWAAALALGSAVAMPLGPLLWAIITGLGIFLLLTSAPGEGLRRSGWILVSLSVPMFWSKRIFNILSDPVLAADAFLVSLITQTEQKGNLVGIPGEKGYLMVAQACSSLANLSLVILCWVLFTQSAGARWRPRNLLFCLLACAAVVLINVIRISLIGFFPQHYDILHGPIGQTVTSWVTVAVSTLICYWGVRRGDIRSI